MECIIPDPDADSIVHDRVKECIVPDPDADSIVHDRVKECIVPDPEQAGQEAEERQRG